MPDWEYLTIAPREPAGPSEAQLAAFLLDLHRYAVIGERYTLISSPVAEISRSGRYLRFPWPPDELDPPGYASHLVSGPELTAGTVVGGWLTVVDQLRDDLVRRPATVHYDGPDLDGVLRALPGAAVGTADVFVLAWPGPSVDHRAAVRIADAVGVAVLAAPADYRVFNGGWSAYRERPPSDGEEEPETGAGDDTDPDLEHAVQWTFDAWSGVGGRGAVCYAAPLCEVLHRHLGPDLIYASDFV